MMMTGVVSKATTQTQHNNDNFNTNHYSFIKRQVRVGSERLDGKTTVSPRLCEYA
ncbi:Hypothetical protein, putative [Bodo saltans]|uniref:Uncharacterized protein n=1 Tax=Bodo saltans TaxID=75058 RepID=A0A0S4ISV5_BODSA|nr:Hypothetical protein, putative [Bodo saltans]|eukprot:CUF63614.1 Hypothetical protein, putative [Bodo saltans]